MPAQLSLPGSVAEGPSFARTGSWNGEGVTSFGCRFRDLYAFLPTFRRQPFATCEHDGRASGPAALNPYLDVIVRNPDRFVPAGVPVATVSPRYALVQHRDAMNAIANALAKRDIAADDLAVEVTISELGSRLACSVQLPREYDFVESDRDRTALTIECFNSVDGSARFRILAGWFRFVCSNGLVIGNPKIDFQRLHTPSLQLGRVEAALNRGLKRAHLERKRFERWQATCVAWPPLTRWAEDTVAKEWGVQAAARMLHIARTGRDARFATSRWRGPLADRPMVPGDVVPGSPPPADTIYKVTQILAWLAGRTREVSTRIERRSRVTQLVRMLAA